MHTNERKLSKTSTFYSLMMVENALGSEKEKHIEISRSRSVTQKVLNCSARGGAWPYLQTYLGPARFAFGIAQDFFSPQKNMPNLTNGVAFCSRFEFLIIYVLIMPKNSLFLCPVIWPHSFLRKDTAIERVTSQKGAWLWPFPFWNNALIKNLTAFRG